MIMWEDRKKVAKGGRFVMSMMMILVLISACKSGDDATEIVPQQPEVREFPGVDERLWSYFERFEEQAAERGVAVDLVAAGITGIIVPIDQENVAGTCNFNARLPNHVMVDEEFFNRVSDTFKEFIIFHELGHCFLFRDHLEDEDNFGLCVSIMRSGTGDCRDNYRGTTRTGYLDELFDPERRNDLFGN